MKKISACLIALTLSGSTFAGTAAQQAAIGQEQQQEQALPADQDQARLEQTDTLALYAIHLTNVAQIRASAIAIAKLTTEATRNEALKIIEARGKNELELFVVAARAGIKAEAVPSELMAWKETLDKVEADLLATPKDSFDGFFSMKISEVNQGLLDALSGFQSQGLVNTQVKEFVDASALALQVDEADPLTPSH